MIKAFQGVYETLVHAVFTGLWEMRTYIGFALDEKEKEGFIPPNDPRQPDFPIRVPCGSGKYTGKSKVKGIKEELEQKEKGTREIDDRGQHLVDFAVQKAQ